ncbi:cysteine--tRNA ligase, cytoplasmic-like [Dendronephthya gigantea]|uniref:cysteine--tRNA ligase, cytoplasmic-like n=1 Tax=Dendronephthya gigantea TaxID=151771 RepID=UPI00106B12A7|nr:cysteine--tRNA ligase, cytoplasmic-like [Dendronephthya gigantea]
MLEKSWLLLVGYRTFFQQNTYRVRDRNSIFARLKGFVTSARFCCVGVKDMKKRSWKQPDGNSELQIHNSLTKEKNDFIPEKGRLVKWYCCGPTVYDASHMGHARAYISFDILRRVFQDYFKYDVFYVMNITDIDDKIIFRARRNYLMKEYKTKNHSIGQILSDIDKSMQKYGEKLVATTDIDKRNMMEKIIRDVDEIKKVLIANDLSSGNNLANEILDKAFDPFSAWLDKQFGSGITDHQIFAELPRHWENEFHKDMEALNILPADCLTRVSQYVPEIVTYIQRIIDNGYGYEAGGSVYFDTVKFASSDQHEYARLVPEAVGDLDALAEGEGELSQNDFGKKSNRDFALWKASKPGEPEWPSPWGKGRPGWHIECSVMASDVLDCPIDIHTGGVDLKFPHHDNELAQAEAHYKCDQWINYFLHAGHLTIEGCKMSKSLKNFVTIKDALAKNSGRQIRLAFLLHSWYSTLDYSENVLKEAVQVEKTFNDFFLAVKDILRKPEVVSATRHNYHGAEKDLERSFHEKKCDVHSALCDSIDTPTALAQMQSLVKLTNIYIASKKQANESPNHQLLENIAKYITDMLRVFGANEGSQAIGFQTSGSSTEANREDIALPYVQLLADFREQVRNIARQEKVGEILKLCDRLRDEDLPNLGVKLEDQEESQSSVIKFVDAETLRKERQQQLEEIERKKREKEEIKRRQEEEKAAKLAKAQLPPSEMFKHETDKYSAFDAQGIPTHDVTGEPISAKQVKKLKKLYQQQEKLYNDLGPGANKQ